MSKPIINLDELEYSSFGRGERFPAKRAPVSDRLGARKLGYAVIRVPPGKRAWFGKSGHPKNSDSFRVFARRDTAVDDWDGEED